MNPNRLYKTILFAWLVAGTLDITGAIFILGKGNAAGTFNYISGAVVGKDIILTKTQSIALGAGFHYLIALCWTVLYFLLYKKIKFDRLHIIISALLYGSLIFFSMRHIFVPLFGKLPPPKPINRSLLPVILKNILILAVAFGVSLKYFAARLYTRQN